MPVRATIQPTNGTDVQILWRQTLERQQNNSIRRLLVKQEISMKNMGRKALVVTCILVTFLEDLIT